METVTKVNEKIRSSIINTITYWGDNPATDRVMRLNHDKGVKNKSSCLEYGCPALILASHEALVYKGGGSTKYEGKYDFYPFQDRIQILWDLDHVGEWYESLEHNKGRGQLKTFFRYLNNKQWRYLRVG
jgi:hypothetical protein